MAHYEYDFSNSLGLVGDDVRRAAVGSRIGEVHIMVTSLLVASLMII